MNSPVAVSVDAVNWSSYESGIFTECNNDDLDHAVLLVGMTNTYWKIKNSWGPDWGEEGFIRIGPGNTCGVCSEISSWVE